MARFHFSIDDGRTLDIFDVESATADAARAEAAVTAGEMLRDLARGVSGLKPWRMTVSDETGLQIFSVDVATGR
jgi:hypothetical protein